LLGICDTEDREVDIRKGEQFVTWSAKKIFNYMAVLSHFTNSLFMFQWHHLTVWAVFVVSDNMLAWPLGRNVAKGRQFSHHDPCSFLSELSASFTTMWILDAEQFGVVMLRGYLAPRSNKIDILRLRPVERTIYSVEVDRNMTCRVKSTVGNLHTEQRRGIFLNMS
jgi:hypothetical protein